jgi:succinyl-diaminopimelate desuccinylase
VINLLDLAQELVAIPSVSRNEGAMAQFVADYLSEAAHLEVIRIGDNVIARTNLGRERRVIVAGHLDTVDTPGISTRREGDVLFGLGSADMKGTLAVMLDLATHLRAPRYDLTWMFYAREEIARFESGLLEIQASQPSLLEADVAILGEPTNALVEAGCQGNVRVKISLAGKSAHTARPWMGVNAIHRVGHLIEDLGRVERRKVAIDGVTFGEQIEAVGVGGGHGGNSVPDEAWITINLRVAPDRSPTEALAWLSEEVLNRHLSDDGDHVEILDAAPGALPSLNDPVISGLVAASGGAVSAKLGWTDAATFSAMGIPAANFGAGNPELAHHIDEQVTHSDLERLRAVLIEVLG